MQTTPGGCHSAVEPVRERGRECVCVCVIRPASLSFNSSHDSLKKQHTQDVAITKATVRKLELQVDSLKRSLEEKVQ